MKSVSKTPMATRRFGQLAGSCFAWLLPLLAMLPAGGGAQAGTRILIDFGQPGMRTVYTNGVYWNDVTIRDPGLVMTNAYATDGARCGVNLTFQGYGFDNIAPSCGTSNSPFYPRSATHDAFMLWNTNKIVTMQFSGLPMNQNCAFTFFSSHTNMPNSTLAFGIGTVTQTLYAYQNTTNTLTLSSMTGTGVVKVTVQAVSNNVGILNAVLNVLEINYEEGAPPTPSMPWLSVYPTNLAFSVMEGGNAPGQSYTVWNGGGGTLEYTNVEEVAWLSVSPPSGGSTGETDTITVDYTTAAWAAGVYTGLVTVAASGASNSPQTVTIVMTVTNAPAVQPAPGIGLNTNSLAVTASVGTSNYVSSTPILQVRNTGGGTLTFSAAADVPWAYASYADNSSTGQWRNVSVYASASNLQAGVYTANVTISSTQATNSPKAVPLVFTVKPRPALLVSPLQLSNVTKPGSNAPTQQITIKNAYPQDGMPFAVATNVPWLAVSTTNGTIYPWSEFFVNVYYRTTNMSAGVYTGQISVTSPAATNSPQIVSVTLTVTSNYETVATPVLSPPGGTYGEPVAVTMSCATPGATIRYIYSQYGGEPNMGSPVYTGAVMVVSNGYVRARAFKDDMQQSGVGGGYYTIVKDVSLAVGPTNLARSVSYGCNATGDTFRIWNAGKGTMNYSVSGGGGWFSVVPGSGSSTGEYDTISLSFNTASLNSGVYTGIVTVSSTGVSNSPQVVKVLMEVLARPSIGLSPATLAQSVIKGSAPTGQTFQIRNAGGGSMSFAAATDVAWAWANPGSGTSGGEDKNIWVNYQGVESLDPGTYTGHVVATSTQAGNSPQSVTLLLTVLPGPQLAVSPATLENSVAVTHDAAPQGIDVWNTGNGNLNYTIETSDAWLAPSPVNGMSTGEHDTVSIAFLTAGLSSGVYTGRVTVSASAAAGSPQVVDVTLSVTGSSPMLAISLTNLTLSAYAGASPAPAEFQLWNAGPGGSLTYAVSSSVPWLAASPVSGVYSGIVETITVSPDTATNPPGEYAAEIRIDSPEAANSPLTLPVTVKVISAPEIGLSTNRLSFLVPANGTAQMPFCVSNTGGGTLSFSVSNEAPWASVWPSAGVSTGQAVLVMVYVRGTNLAAGTYTSVVSVVAGEAVNSPRTVTVSLTVRPSPALDVAPAQLANTAVQGSNASNQWIAIRNANPPDGMHFTVWSTVGWLTVTPESGMNFGTPQAAQVGYQCAGMGAGVYTGAVMVAADLATNSPAAIPVTLTIQAADSVIAFSPAAISARVSAGSGGTEESGVEIWNAGQNGASMSYTLTPDVAWLTVAPASGVSTGLHAIHAVWFTNTGALAAGAYTGHIAIASDQAGNSPRTATACLWVEPAPAAVAVSPASQSLSLVQGAPPSELTFDVWNSGGGNAMPFTLQGSVRWLTLKSCGGSSGGEPVTATGVVSVAGLAPGEYDGAILVSAPSATNSPVAMGVHLTVTPQPALIAVSPAACSATLYAGGNAATQQLWIGNGGTGAMSYALSVDSSWLSVTPPTGAVAGVTRKAHQVVCQAIGLAEGIYTGAVSIAGEGAVNTPFPVPVLLRVLPALSASPALLSFTASASNNPASQTLQVWNSGSANPVDYTVSAGAPWLSVDPAGGTSSGELDPIAVNCAAAGLAPGVYDSHIDVAPAGAAGAARRIPVKLTVQASGSAFQERIVFSRAVNGDQDIWCCAPDGSNLMLLVSKPSQQFQPRVSPDGLKLAYRSAYPAPTRLIVRDLATGVESQYMDLVEFDWTADSRALIGNDTVLMANDIWKVGLDGSRARLFVENDRQTMWGVDWTSDRVYYVTDAGYVFNSDLRLFDPATSNRLTVLPRDGRFRDQGEVSRDGRQLAYRRQSPVWLHVRAADGTGERPLVNTPNPTDRYPDFSPDGAQAVFVRSNILYRVPTSGWGAPVQVIGGASDYPDWCTMLVPTSGAPRISVAWPALYPWCTFGSNALYQMVRIANTGGGQLNFTASGDVPWFTVTPTAGTSYSSNNWVYLKLDFFTAGMGLGYYTGRVTIAAADAANSPVIVPVILNVRPPAAAIDCQPDRLTNSCVTGFNADSQSLQIRNSGGGTLSYSVSSNVTWLSVSPVGGWSTGETDAIIVSYRTAGLAPGLATGTVTVTAGGAVNSPFKVPVSVQVLPVPTNEQPVLSVWPTVLTNASTAGDKGPRQSFRVQNSGGGLLTYTVSDNASWLAVSPSSGVSAGEPDWIAVEYNTESLPTGVHTAVISVGAGAETQTVAVSVNVGPSPTYLLTLIHNPPNGGMITYSVDFIGSWRYPKGTVIDLTADPYADFTFDCWLGTFNSTGRTVTVRMDSDVVETANFRRRTALSGYVTNAVTGSPVKYATVKFGTNCVQTSVSGYYGFRDVGTMTDTLRVSRVGYQAREEVYSPPAFASTVKNMALTPAFVSNVRAAQRPGTKLVDIYYDFEALVGDIPVVGLGLSSGGGTTWDVVPRTVTGDIGANVAPGPNRRIVWDAGKDWPSMFASGMTARVSAGGSACLSAPFSVVTRESGLWRVRTWADRNRNGLCDANEALGGVEIYYDGRTAANIVGLTGNDGYLTIDRPALKGRTLFGRKRIFTQATPKPGRAAVSNLMYSLWMDTDIGGTDNSDWDGTWRSYVVSAADVAKIETGEPVSLQLAHPVFQWHLVVASEISSPAFLAQVRQGLEGASALLYDATDGQMKFGAVAITSYTNFTQRADIVIHSYAGKYMGTYPAGMYFPNAGGISVGSTLWNGATPNQPAYYATLVRMFFSYAMGLMPEDANGMSDPVKWSQYRAQHPEETPLNYGLMDNPLTSSELSSYNKYLPFYPAKTNAYKVTLQIWRRDLCLGPVWTPCWQQVERQFQNFYNGIWVEIVTPRRGCYLGYNEYSTGDRPGPFFIPAPYTACAFTDVPGSTRGVLAAPPLSIDQVGPVRAGAAPLRVFVTRDGRTVVGAEALRKPANGGRVIPLGRTDSSGGVRIYDLAEEDVLEVSWRGLLAAYTVAPVDMWCDSISIPLPFSGASAKSGPGAALTSRLPAVPLSGNALGLVVSGSLASDPRSLAIAVQVNQALAEAPVVIAYLDDGSSNTIAMAADAGGAYTGVVALGASQGGTLRVDCRASGGETRGANAAFEIAPTSTNETSTLRSQSGRAEVTLTPDSLPAESEGVVYEGDLPPIVPDGFVQTNLVGAPVFVALAGGAAWSVEPILSMSYQDSDLEDLDESTVRLYAWESAASNWTEVASSLSLDQNRVTASLPSPGVYALFANSSSDHSSPAAITNLLASTGTNSWTVELTWTAVGDDGTDGQAATYEIRYSTSMLTNWDEGTVYSLPLVPAAPGETETVVLRMSDPNTLYSFAVKAVDEAGNAGEMSNESEARSQFADENHDGIPDQALESLEGDVDLDSDDDSDGLTLQEELDAHTEPENWDTDGDKMGDGWEIDHGLNPLSAADAGLDGDHDGLTNLQEAELGTDPTSADSDGDGIPDGWEKERKLDAISQSGDNAPDADPDNDSFNNLQEYIADTDPQSATSLLAITSCGLDAGKFRLEFDSSANRQYDILRRSDLQGGGWESITNYMQGLGGATAVTDTDSTNHVFFYRVRVHEPAP